VQCSTAIPYCANCTNANGWAQCTACSNGLTLNNNACLSCDYPNCLACAPVNGGSSCVQCASGYYINGQGTCSACTDAVSDCI